MRSKTKLPSTTDEYLALVSEDKRAALEALRATIRSAAPKAEECISYGIPAFRLGGRLLVAFAAAKNHCSFFPGAHPITVHAADLQNWKKAKGTVRFTPERPLPKALVRKLVKTRIAERAPRG